MFSRIIKDRNFLTIFISLLIVIVVYICSNFFYVLNKNIQNNREEKKEYILISSDMPNAVVDIIKKLNGLSQYMCVTSTRISDSLSLARSLDPVLMILSIME